MPDLSAASHDLPLSCLRNMGESAMPRKQLPAASILPDLSERSTDPGHIQALRRNGPELHPCRSSKPACLGQRSARRSRLHGANDGAVFPAAKQPRQPVSVSAGEWSVQVDLKSDRASQAPPRFQPAPDAGVDLDRSGTDGQAVKLCWAARSPSLCEGSASLVPMGAGKPASATK